MSLTAFVLAALALLLAPGPTNTLMAVAGAQRGLGHVLRLLPAEMLGYAITIGPLLWLGAPLLARWPALGAGLTLAAAAWVLVLAVRLWRPGPDGADMAGIDPRRVCLTTILNPKAAVFGLVLLPAPTSAGLALRLALFLLMVAGAALAWATLGALSRRGAGASQDPRLVQRIASAWLACIALTLIAKAVSA